VTDVLGGVALVGAGVGLYLTLKPKPTATALRLAPMGASGFALRGTF
jgi:hypothetical protein